MILNLILVAVITYLVWSRHKARTERNEARRICTTAAASAITERKRAEKAERTSTHISQLLERQADQTITQLERARTAETRVEQLGRLVLAVDARQAS